jgi:CheY-like chemotaxis protein
LADSQTTIAPDGFLSRNTRSGESVILYAEDDDATAHLFQVALEEMDVEVRCFRVNDGREAIDFILRHGKYAHAPSPDLIILDLHLPKVGGFEALTEIRCRAHLNHVPVVLYTTSTDARDRETAIALGATAYLVKGGDFSAFMEAARSACALIPRGPVMLSA